MNQDRWKVLDANHGKTNVIPHEEVYNTMHKAFGSIREMLMDHCGPWGKFAMVVDAMHPDMPPKFTKDGINIIRAMDFFNPMEEIVRDELAFIGHTTERAAGDGTTSAMIIAAKAIEDLLSKYKTRKLPRYIDLVNEFEKFKAAFEEVHSTLVVKWEDLKTYNESLTDEECIKMVATWQGLSSSHGDTELADLAAKVFTTVPRDAWRHITFQQEKYETDTRLRCEIDDDQYRMQAKPMYNSVYNTKAETEYLQEACTLIVLSSTLSGQDHISSAAINKLKEYKESGLPIALICPAGIDQYVQGQLMDIIDENCAIFTTPHGEPRCNNVTGLQCVAGLPATQSVEDIKPIDDARVEFRNGELIINNLYPNPDNALVHPQSENPKTRIYSVLETIEETIADMEKDNPNPQLLKDIQNLRQLYTKMKYTRHYKVYLGGSARESAYMLDLISDVLVAVKNSLMDGFVPSANVAMLAALSSLSDLSPEQTLFRAAFIGGIRNVLAVLSDNDKTVFTRLCKVVKDEDGKVVPHSLKHFNAPVDVELFRGPGGVLGTAMRGIDDAMQIQPAMVETNLIKRFGDCMLKFLYTHRIVVCGGVYTGTKKEPSGSPT